MTTFVVREAFLKRKKQFSKLTKITKNRFFEVFMQLLSIFRKTWWIRILKTFNKKIYLSGRLLLTNKRSFPMKKVQIATKKDKYTKTFQFFTFLGNFCQICKILHELER